MVCIGLMCKCDESIETVSLNMDNHEPTSVFFIATCYYNVMELTSQFDSFLPHFLLTLVVIGR